MTPRVVLLGHGSPDRRHGADLRAVALALATRLTTADASARVGVAFLEHDHPQLPEAAQHVSLGAGSDEGVRVVPLFFSAGYHVRHDVPAHVAAADAECHLPVRVVPPPLLTKDDPWTLAALVESAGAAGSPPAPHLAAVVATAGSTDRDVLRAWDAAAAWWTQDGPWAAVEVAHASGPGRRPEVVADGLRKRGLAVQVLVPALVARGFFADRLAVHAAALGVAEGAVVGTTDAVLDRIVGLLVSAD